MIHGGSRVLIEGMQEKAGPHRKTGLESCSSRVCCGCVKKKTEQVNLFTTCAIMQWYKI